VAGWIGVAPPSSASSADSRTSGRCCRFAFVAGSSRAPCRLDDSGQARLRAGKGAGAGRALKRPHLLPDGGWGAFFKRTNGLRQGAVPRVRRSGLPPEGENGACRWRQDEEVRASRERSAPCDRAEHHPGRAVAGRADPSSTSSRSPTSRPWTRG
jgi:hypothetical protein